MTGTNEDPRPEVERWFRNRGVPQLIRGYGTEAHIDSRAAPLILGWLAIGTLLFWGVNPAWSRAANLVGVLATLAVIGLGVAALRWLRGVPLRSSGRMPFGEVVAMGALPAVPAAIIESSIRELFVSFLNAMLGIGVIYVIVVFGLAEIAAWAVARLGSQLTEMVGLLGRTLPLLLILVVFLLFAAELWEAAHHLTGLELGALVTLLLLVAVVLVATSVRRELRGMEATTDWRPVLAGARSRPPIIAEDGRRDQIQGPPPLTWQERANLVVLALIGVLIQALSVSALVMAFLALFGLLAVPADVQAGWIGEPIHELATVSLLGENRTITAELLVVSGLLSGIVGLYFTGLAVTDSAYRGEYLDRLLAELRELLAVRAWYHAEALPHRGLAEDARPSSAT